MGVGDGSCACAVSENDVWQLSLWGGEREGGDQGVVFERGGAQVRFEFLTVAGRRGLIDEFVVVVEPD